MYDLYGKSGFGDVRSRINGHLKGEIGGFKPLSTVFSVGMYRNTGRIVAKALSKSLQTSYFLNGRLHLSAPPGKPASKA